MRAYQTDVVVRLGSGVGCARVNLIREDAILVCRPTGATSNQFFDLGTGLLHGADPRDLDPTQIEILDEPPTVLLQFVATIANPQVRVDQLYQGLKANSVVLPSNVKFRRNYLGGVYVVQGNKRLSVAAVISFILKEFDKGKSA